jgi:glucose/arabinose dehydrogenase
MIAGVRRSRGFRHWTLTWGLLAGWMLMMVGCASAPALVEQEQHAGIDRRIVEYPASTVLTPFVTGLTGPTAIAFDTDGALLIAEGGVDGRQPRIFGYRGDGSQFQIYPRGQRLPFQIGKVVGLDGFRIHGPIGGMVATQGRIYISHRDQHGRGAITALDYEGHPSTIVADLPAQGDYPVTDLAVASNGRLYFGVGAATNSGVVGIDNNPWLRNHRAFCDQPASDLYLLGRRFDTPNPFAGLLGGTDISVTAPFQSFGHSIDTHIRPPANRKANAAIYSIDPNGGDLRLEAHGIRYPAGLAFSETGTLFVTNQGMKLRGTRPVKDDPDVLLRIVHGQWYGWPDFAANLQPIRDARFQPPGEMLVKTGYRDLSFLIDHDSSGLAAPNPHSNLLMAEFRPLSGAAKFDFVPASGPFSNLRQSGNVALVALSGDRAPFDTSGLKLTGPTGYRVVQVNIDDRQVREFVRNTRGEPASRSGDAGALERPIDVKFGPDGAIYILDFGQMEMKNGREQVKAGTGRIYKLAPAEAPVAR